MKNFEAIARVFHSLGDKTRLSIIALLSTGEMNGTAICKELKLPQSGVSHHMGLLRAAGLVVPRRSGKQIFYSYANLPKHPLGQKSELSVRGTNAVNFGPAELAFSKP